MRTQLGARVAIVSFVVASIGALVSSASCSKSDGTPPNATVDAADAGAIEVAPLAPPGCFSGTPSQPLDFLNACTDASFVVFDDCARLGFCGDAALPDRVAPPPEETGSTD